jgi:hypothetical protein
MTESTSSPSQGLRIWPQSLNGNDIKANGKSDPDKQGEDVVLENRQINDDDDKCLPLKLDICLSVYGYTTACLEHFFKKNMLVFLNHFSKNKKKLF